MLREWIIMLCYGRFILCAAEEIIFLKTGLTMVNGFLNRAGDPYHYPS
jgi:hypothetical protein